MKVTTDITEEQIDNLLDMACYLWEIEEYGKSDPTHIIGNPYSHFVRMSSVARELGCKVPPLRRGAKLMCKELSAIKNAVVI